MLQRRRNHETFKYYAVAQEKRPDLLEKFGITQTPTLVVVEDKLVSAPARGAERLQGHRAVPRALAAVIVRVTAALRRPSHPLRAG